MSAVKISECNKIYDGFGFNLEETHLCAGGEIGKCASAEDGGSGLFSKLSEGRWEVVGIASAGTNTCDDGVPDVYTRVSQYIKLD